MIRQNFSPLVLAACLAAPSAACGRAPAVTLHPDMGAASRTTVEGVRYDAVTTSLEDGSLRTSVTITNTTSQPVDLGIPGGCPVLVRAYRTPERHDVPAWDQSAHVVCTMELRLLQLAPGEAETVHSPAFTAQELRAAGVGPGMYYLTGTIRPEASTIELTSGAITVDR